jgi:osmotically-inducible protein OsmY
MKQLLASFLIVGAIGCANLSRQTPASMDNTAIETEIRKNMAADGITGMHIDVNGSTVTLTGDVKTDSDRQKAYNDAAKVKGVSTVVNNIAIKP